MRYNELIIQLFDEMEREFNDYLSVENIIKKLDEIYSDYNKISIISDDDLVLLDDVSGKIVGYLKYILVKNSYDEEEVKNSIIYIKEQLIKKLQYDIDYYQDLGKKINYYANLKSIINSNIKSDYGIILEFIELCYKEKKVSLEQAITLNFDVAGSIVNKNISTDEIEEKEELEENSVPIYEQLEEIFRKYNYDYNNLNKRIREKFNKYAKIDYVDYILSKLYLYNVSQKDLLDNQKEILRIIIDKNNNTFEEICNFIDNNNCTMSNLLSFGAVFHKKKKRYVIKKSNKNGGKDSILENDDDLSIVGTFDDFMANIEFLKKTDGVTLIDDGYLKKKKVFINASNYRIMTNLEILRKYGICASGDVPKELTCLTAAFTTYQLDRFIEVGLFDYIRKNLSYLKAPKNPFKFYKIRRAQDLGVEIFESRGMKHLYTDDNEDLHGISYININVDDKNEKKILQDNLSKEDLDSIPKAFKRDLKSKYYSFTEDEYYRKMNSDSYRFAEFNPTRLFPKYEANTLPIQLESYLKTDDYSVSDYDDSVLDDKYIKLLDSAYCRTSENNYGTTYNIKKDENTYEFRPIDFPNIVITISRQKVLRLCKLLKDNNFWIKDSYSFENKCDMLLCVLIKDSVLSYWEVSYLRNILKNIIGNTLEKKANFRHRGGRRC